MPRFLFQEDEWEFFWGLTDEQIGRVFRMHKDKMASPTYRDSFGFYRYLDDLKKVFTCMHIPVELRPMPNGKS